MTRDAWTEHLRNVPLFDDFDNDDFRHLSRITTELQVKAGKTVMRKDTIGHELVIVLDGELEVTRDGEHVADITRGGFAGEMSLLTHMPRNATVTAKTDATLLVIDGRGFATLLHDVPELAVKMLPVVAKRVYHEGA